MAKKFLTDIKIAAGVYDSSGDIGNSGQVLSSTGSGVNWINTTTSASVIYQDGFTGNGSTTAFTLANSIDNENKTQVYIDGVYQHKDNYSLSGTTLTFSTAPPNSSDIEVISFSSVTAADDILYDTDFASAGLMTTNGSGVYSITTNNSSNWNTAYTYSQVGHLPLAGGAITGAITTNSTFDGRDVSVDGTKLDGIEANATADQTNAEIRAAVEAATDSNVFTDADHTKLNAIEASADVTDTANVTAAGALMDSELTDLAGVKAVTISDLATETYVDTAVSDLVDSSPATLNTLNELAAALGDDPNFATTTANSIGTKLPLAGGTLTGGLTGTTASFSGSITASGNSNSFGNTTIAALSASTGTFSASVTAAGNSNSFGATTFTGNVGFNDSTTLSLGGSGDLFLIHDATNSIIGNSTGNLIIRNDADDSDIIFQSDNGSGGRDNYLTIDGGVERIFVHKLMRFDDNVELRLGGNNDIRLYHNSTSGNNNFENHTGGLFVTQYADDGNIIFRSDDGSGGVAEYIVVNGGAGSVQLKHYGNTKFETTSTGIGVTGNGVFSGDITIGGKTYPKLNLTDNQGVARNFSIGTNNETFTVRNETAGADVFTIAGADNAATFAGSVKIESNDGLTIHATTDAVDAKIVFSSIVPSLDQKGTFAYNHANSLSYGSAESFVISGTESTMTILADGKLMYNEGIYSKPASGTGAGTRKDSNWDTAYTYSQVGHLPLAGGTVTGDITISSTSPELKIVDTNSFTDVNDRWIVRGGTDTLIMRWFDWSLGANTDALTLSPTVATFAGQVNATRFILPSTGTTTPVNHYIFTNNTNTGTGSMTIQAGGGSAGYGGGLKLYSHSHATKPGWVQAGISSGSGGKFTVNTAGTGGGSDVFMVDANGTTINGASQGLSFLGGNNRIYFNGHRALEGATDGGILQIGEGYSQIRIQDTTLIKYLTSADSSTFLTLHNDVGADLDTQKTFIDFIFEDDNDNDWPQVRIGAEVGHNGNANSQLKEGSGAFVVYTNNASTNDPGNPSNLAERFRVDYQGHTTATGSLRAPIFYDSSNTGYYTYPSNQSVFYRLKLQGTGTANAATLEIDNPSSSAFIHSGELFTTNMTAGQANIFVIGKEGSTKNSGYIGYNYASAGSNNNYVTIGHWGADHLLRIYGDVITTSLSFRGDSDVRGTIFYDSNDTGYYVNPASTSHLNVANYGSLTWDNYSNNPTAKINVEVAGGNAINIYNTHENKAYLNFIDSQSDGTQYCNLSFDSGSNYFTLNNMGNDTMFVTSGGYSKLTNNGNTTWNAYNFHSITNSAADQPTVMIYSHASSGNVYGINVLHRSTSANTSGRFFLGATNSGASERIKIYSNGNIQNSNNSYGQLSDINLKENIVDATPKLDEINQVRVVNFNYIDDINEETNAPTKQIGVVAQELEKIFPGLVYECGDTETPTKSVKYSVFVPMLIKAMQELTQEVKTLKNQINGIN